MKKAVFAAAFSLIALSAGAQVIYNSSGRPREEGRDRDRRSRSTPAKEGFDPQRIIWGGGINLGFGRGLYEDQSSFNVGASPIVGYAITEKFSAGVGIGYSYFRMKNAYNLYNGQTGIYEDHNLTAHFYYPSVWTRYIVWRDLFVQAAFEYDIQRYGAWDLDRDINSPTYAQPVRQPVTYTSPALFAGIGIRRPISDRVSLVATGMFEFLRDENSPYLYQRLYLPFVGDIINLPFDLRFGVNVGF